MSSTPVSQVRIYLISIHQNNKTKKNIKKKTSKNQDRELHTRCEGSPVMMLIITCARGVGACSPGKK